MKPKHIESPLPLWTAAKAWWSDTAAQDCASFNWLFILVIFIASSIAISLPFGANRWREAEVASKTSQYPGLGTAFEALAKTDVAFMVNNGMLQTTADTKSRTLEAGGWRILVSSVANTPEQAATDTSNILQLGPDRFIVRNGKTGVQISSPLTAFEGFSSDILKQAAENRRTLSDLIESLLFTAAFSSIPSTMITLGLLMLIQNLVFVVMLGVMLSFSVYRKRLGEYTSPSVRPLDSIKMATAIMAGPAFIVGLLGLFIPALQAPFLWLAYSLLAGIRVIVLYTSRYRGAEQPR